MRPNNISFIIQSSAYESSADRTLKKTTADFVDYAAYIEQLLAEANLRPEGANRPMYSIGFYDYPEGHRGSPRVKEFYKGGRILAFDIDDNSRGLIQKFDDILQENQINHVTYGSGGDPAGQNKRHFLIECVAQASSAEQWLIYLYDFISQLAELGLPVHDFDPALTSKAYGGLNIGSKQPSPTNQFFSKLVTGVGFAPRKAFQDTVLAEKLHRNIFKKTLLPAITSKGFLSKNEHPVFGLHNNKHHASYSLLCAIAKSGLEPESDNAKYVFQMVGKLWYGPRVGSTTWEDHYDEEIQKGNLPIVDKQADIKDHYYNILNSDLDKQRIFFENNAHLVIQNIHVLHDLHKRVATAKKQVRSSRPEVVQAGEAFLEVAQPVLDSVRSQLVEYGYPVEEMQTTDAMGAPEPREFCDWAVRNMPDTFFYDIRKGRSFVKADTGLLYIPIKKRYPAGYPGPVPSSISDYGRRAFEDAKRDGKLPDSDPVQQWLLAQPPCPDPRMRPEQIFPGVFRCEEGYEEFMKGASFIATMQLAERLVDTNPNEAPDHRGMPIFVSPQKTGKDTLIRNMASLCGYRLSENLTAAKTKSGRHDADLYKVFTQKMIVHDAELVYHNNIGYDEYKDVITRTSINFSEKGQEPKDWKVRASFWGSTNSNDSPIRTLDDERRFMIVPLVKWDYSSEGLPEFYYQHQGKFLFKEGYLEECYRYCRDLLRKDPEIVYDASSYLMPWMKESTRLKSQKAGYMDAIMSYAAENPCEDHYFSTDDILRVVNRYLHSVGNREISKTKLTRGLKRDGIECVVRRDKQTGQARKFYDIRPPDTHKTAVGFMAECRFSEWLQERLGK